MTTETKRRRGGRYNVCGPTGFVFAGFSNLREAEKCLKEVEAATSIIWHGRYVDGTPGRTCVKFADK